MFLQTSLSDYFVSYFCHPPCFCYLVLIKRRDRVDGEDSSHENSRCFTMAEMHICKHFRRVEWLSTSLFHYTQYRKKIWKQTVCLPWNDLFTIHIPPPCQTKQTLMRKTSTANQPWNMGEICPEKNCSMRFQDKFPKCQNELEVVTPACGCFTAIYLIFKVLSKKFAKVRLTSSINYNCCYQTLQKNLIPVHN